MTSTKRNNAHPTKLAANGLPDAPARAGYDLSRRPGFLLRKAYQVAVAIFSEEIGNLTLTPPQHNVLSALMANPGCHQTEPDGARGRHRPGAADP